MPEPYIEFGVDLQTGLWSVTMINLEEDVVYSLAIVLGVEEKLAAKLVGVIADYDQEIEEIQNGK